MDAWKITDQEWAVLEGISQRLGIDLKTLREGGVRFTDLEAAGHRLRRIAGKMLALRRRIFQPCSTTCRSAAVSAAG